MLSEKCCKLGGAAGDKLGRAAAVYHLMYDTLLMTGQKTLDYASSESRDAGYASRQKAR